MTAEGVGSGGIIGGEVIDNAWGRNGRKQTHAVHQKRIIKQHLTHARRAQRNKLYVHDHMAHL